MSTSTQRSPILEDALVASARQGKLHVFWAPDDHGIWTSPNASTLPLPVPEVEQYQGFYRQYFKNPRMTRWMSRFESFLGFWPLCHPWTGPFACLDLPVGQLPLERSQILHRVDLGQSYYLAPAIVKRWQDLEDKLVLLSTGLLRRHVQARHDWSEIRVSKLPHECGFEQLYAKHDIATMNIIASRNAFVVLSCFVSFTIALDIAMNPPLSERPPSWLTYAVETLGMDPVWLSAINNTFVCNFSPGFRPGSFVKASSGGFAQTYPAFEAGNVPLYINWGYNPPRWLVNDDDYRWRYRPSRAEANHAIDIYYAKLDSELDTRLSQKPGWYNPNARPPETGPIQDSPESPPADIQKDNEPSRSSETPTQFFERVALERERIMAKENEDAVRRRHKEETWADVVRMCDQAPTLETFVVWTEVEEGNFVRLYVNDEGRKTAWMQTTEEDRRYIYDYAEWHLVPKRTIDPDDVPIPEKQRSLSPQPDEPSTLAEYMDLSDESSDEEDTRRQGLKRGKGKQAAPNPNKRPALQSPRQSGPQSTPPSVLQLSQSALPSIPQMPQNAPLPTLQLLQSAPPSAPQLPPTTFVTTPSVIDNLRRRYMFLVNEPYIADPRAAGLPRLPDPNPEPGQLATYKSATRVLKELGLSSKFPSPDATRAAMDFYDFVFASPAKKLFSPVWGFVPTDSSSITHHKYFHYRRLRNDLHIIGIRGDKPLVQQWYLLVIPDARAVVELFRQHDLNSISAMVRYLVGNGIPFFTGKPVQKLPRPNPTSRITREYRPTSYTFGLTDFIQYEQKKVDFLAGPAGRAAVTKGGIVWRLSRDQVEAKRITKGPTSEAAASGIYISDLDGSHLVDDAITQEDEDVLCGTYLIYTRTFIYLPDAHGLLMNYLLENNTQVEQRSWFPKSNIWNSSGFNHSYWTADDEDFYQLRRQDIQNNAQPLNSHEWRKYMKRVRGNRVEIIRNWISSTADRFLQDDASNWEA